MTTPPQTDMRLVALGGGNGTSQVLLGARPYFAHRTAIVGVTDTGRSTGVARAIGDMPAPGDLRNTLATLSSEPESLVVKLLQHRFHSDAVPDLKGMAFGNLLIAALKEMHDDFASAIETLATLARCQEQVLPISTDNAHLCAELEDGSVMDNELAVRGLNKAPIRHLFLSPPDAAAHPPAIEAVTSADLVVIGPGSFFTSVLATLLFQGMVDALQRTRATVVFICNTTTQPGQTDGFNTFDHIDRLVAVLGKGTLDIALINQNTSIDTALLAQYAADGVYLVQPYQDEIERIVSLGVQPLVGDYVEPTECKRNLWNKQDTIRHNTALLGEALWEVARNYATY
jgi:uncharacterized cofD-like protein